MSGTYNILSKRFSIKAAIGWLGLIILAYTVSFGLLGYYTQGDQVHYRAFYDALDGASLGEAFSLQQKHLGSAEPVFAIVMWLGAKLSISKSIYTSLLNIGLVTALVGMLRRWEAGFLVVILCLTNYYLIVLMTGAERLKIAYMFLFWSAAIDPGRIRWCLLAVAPLAHFQTMLMYIALFFSEMVGKRRLVPTSAWQIIQVTMISLAAAVVTFSVLHLIDARVIIAQKIEYYIDSYNFRLEDFVPGIVLLVIGTASSRRKASMVMSISILLLATAFLGPGRMNMITFSVFFYILMVDKRLNSAAALLPLAYLSLKSPGIIANILIYGTGFPVTP